MSYTKSVKELINKEIKIGDKEGEIINVLGCQWCEIEFFNIIDGRTRIHIDEIDKYLV